MSWSTCTFSEVADINPPISLKKGEIATYVAMESLIPWNRDVRSAIKKTYSGGTRFLNGDILLARITPSLENGKTSIYRALEDSESEPAFGSTEFIVVRGKHPYAITEFLYYGLRLPMVRAQLVKSMTGSSGRQRVQTAVFSKIKLQIPTISEQEQMVSLLGALDDKIESNSSVIAYCKELILTQLDKYLSINRSSIELSSVLDVRDGTHDSPKLMSEGYYLITSKNLKSFSVLGESDKKISKEAFDDINKRSKVDELDILVSMIGTVGRVSLVLEPSPDYAIKNVGLIKTSKAREYAPFVYAYLASMHGQRSIANCLAGSTQKFLSLTALRKLLLPELTQKELGDFSSFCRPLLDAILNNQTEIFTLITLRDTLLPELMSGRMRVDEAQGLIMNVLETEDTHV